MKIIIGYGHRFPDYNTIMSGDLKLIPNDFEKNKQVFLNAKSHLAKVLSDYAVQVEHIGSTAIPDTLGKGIIDILIIADSENDQTIIRDILTNNGYRQGELHKVPDGRLFFCNTPAQTQAGDIHLHVVVREDDHNLNSLLFRNYLLSHPETVEHYNAEKVRLAHITKNTRHEYTAEKGNFIEKIMSIIKSDEEPSQSRE